MATVQLNGVWIALASDLPNQIFAGSMGSMGASSSSGATTAQPRSDIRATGGAVRQYANGTFRTIWTVGILRTYTCTLRVLGYADCETLESWVNQTVLIRDRNGRQWYGSYNSISISDYQGGSQLHDVAFVFVQTSYSDEVLISVAPAGTSSASQVEILTTSLPGGQVGLAYSAVLQASGGTPPYEWIATPPPGLVLNAQTGAITGIPTAAGQQNFEVQVADSTSPTPLAAETLLGIAVAAAPATLEVTTSSLPTAYQGSPVGDSLVASGGTAPYSWSLVSGSLPAGLTLTQGGVIAGTPTGTGSSSFTVKATDSGSPTAQTATAELSLTVSAEAQPLQITTTALPNATEGVAYSYQLSAAGGSPPYSWAAATLPSGVGISSSGLISGTPTESGDFSLTLSCTDSLGNKVTASDVLLGVAASSQQALLAFFVTGQSPSGEASAAAALGVTVTAITQYGNNSSPYGFSPPSGLGGKRLIVGLGAMSTSTATSVAEALVAAGCGDAYIRLMWEMNGNWFDWGIDGGSLGYSASEYVSEWQAVYDAMMAVSGAAFEFVWNVNGASTVPTSAYPGDSYVQVVAIDQYNYSGAYEGNVNAALAFAQEHGKPFAIGEWGCESGSGETGDDPTYINWMADFIKNPANNVAFQVYFDSPPITNYPNSEAAYKNQFAGASGGDETSSTGFLGGNIEYVTGSPPSPDSITLDVPSGAQEGDLLLAFITTSHNDILWGSQALPSGWSSVTQTTYATAYAPLMVASHVCTADEPASYTFALPSGVNWYNPMGIVHLVSAGGATASVDVAYNAASQTAPAATPTNPGEYLVRCYSDYNGTAMTAPSGTTQREAAENGSLVAAMSCDAIASTTASVGTAACGGGSGEGCSATVLVVI